MTARVVLVRGARTSASGGGGCCSGDVRPFDEGGGHAHAPPGDEVVAVYRALRSVLPADDVELVSPSNWLWLLPALARDGRRRGLRGHRLAASVRAGLAAPSLVVEGRVLYSGRLPSPAAAVAAVEGELALR